MNTLNPNPPTVFFPVQPTPADLLHILRDFLEMKSTLTPPEIARLIEALDLKILEASSIHALAALRVGQTALICGEHGLRECRVFDARRGTFFSYLRQTDAAA